MNACKTRRGVVLVLLLSAGLLIGARCGAQPAIADPPVLKLAPLGRPVADKQKAAQKIHDLRLFDGRLFLGHGDAGVNTGPTDVLSYDFKDEEFVHEFTVEDEAIERFCLLDGSLVIPGTDATEDWTFGNLYVREEAGWTKHRTIPLGVHVFDAVSFRGRWFVATGSVVPFAKRHQLSSGAVLASNDRGRSWSVQYTTPTSAGAVYRVQSLVVFRHRLYAFPYAYAVVHNEGVPGPFRERLVSPFQPDKGKPYYLMFLADALGPADAVVLRLGWWQPVDLIREPHTCMIRPFVFADRLLLVTMSGQNVFWDRHYRSDDPAVHIRKQLFVHDGETTQLVRLEFDEVLDVLTKDERCYLLLRRDRAFLIAETADLKSWRYRALPELAARPLCVEFDGKSFYLGLSDGTILKSEPDPE